MDQLPALLPPRTNDIGTELPPELASLAKSYVPPSETQRPRMKPVAKATTFQVLRNLPMPTVPRRADDADVSSDDLVRTWLAGIYSDLPYIGEEITFDSTDREIDAFVRRLGRSHQTLGMESQLQTFIRRATEFKRMRKRLIEALEFKNKKTPDPLGATLQVAKDEGILRPDCVIPNKYIVDMGMAVPVWYFAVAGAENKVPWLSHSHRHRQNERDFVHSLMPTVRWGDTFGLFNLWIRGIQQYQGDRIPMNVLDRMQRLAPYFDNIVIMTPYHDVASAEWENARFWARNIDPYVVGFTQDVPFFFILDRFSQSGLFPLFSEMVADTIDFIRKNVDLIPNEEWPRRSQFSGYRGARQANHSLQDHARELLTVFDAGALFDWVRSGEPIKKY